MDRAAGHRDLAVKGLADAKDLTNAGDVMGKERIKALRKAGHPFGRGANSGASTATGRLRNGGGIRGAWPFLPLGIISGKLHNTVRMSNESSRGRQSFGVGPRNVPYAIYIMGTAKKQGTSKMVARGYPNEIRRRWRARNKAFSDVYNQKQTS